MSSNKEILTTANRFVEMVRREGEMEKRKAFLVIQSGDDIWVLVGNTSGENIASMKFSSWDFPAKTKADTLARKIKNHLLDSGHTEYKKSKYE